MGIVFNNYTSTVVNFDFLPPVCDDVSPVVSSIDTESLAPSPISRSSSHSTIMPPPAQGIAMLDELWGPAWRRSTFRSYM